MTASYHDIEQFIIREARFLDDREWDKWLECYHDDVAYWMPAWDDNGELTDDPQSEISLIYYPNKKGLEDRVYRIKTERSGATSMPEPRVTHFTSNLEILSQDEREIKVRFNWLTKAYRYDSTAEFFGTSFYTLEVADGGFLIRDKKLILNNDRINQVLDVYHL